MMVLLMMTTSIQQPRTLHYRPVWRMKARSAAFMLRSLKLRMNNLDDKANELAVAKAFHEIPLCDINSYFPCIIAPLHGTRAYRSPLLALRIIIITIIISPSSLPLLCIIHPSMIVTFIKVTLFSGRSSLSFIGDKIYVSCNFTPPTVPFLCCQCTSTDIFLKYPDGSYTGDLGPGRRYNTVAFLLRSYKLSPHFLPFTLFIYFFLFSFISKGSRRH